MVVCAHIKSAQNELEGCAVKVQLGKSISLHGEGLHQTSASVAYPMPPINLHAWS